MPSIRDARKSRRPFSKMISQVVAGSWGDRGAFSDLATWSPHANACARITLRHSVRRHSQLSGSQLTAQFLSRAVNPFSFTITDGTTHQLSQKRRFEMPGLWKKNGCPMFVLLAVPAYPLGICLLWELSPRLDAAWWKNPKLGWGARRFQSLLATARRDHLKITSAL